jgi:peptidoglycan hydrolase-like protein with peptidoglycan-binding domain
MNIQTTLVGVAITVFSIGAYAQQEQESMPGGQQQTQLQQQNQMRNLSQNTSAVRQIQQKLKDHGYQVGSVDGKWGPQTQQALMQFQQAQGLTASGNINNETLSSLGFSRSDIAAFEQQQQQQQQLQQHSQPGQPQSGQPSRQPMGGQSGGGGAGGGGGRGGY